MKLVKRYIVRVIQDPTGLRNPVLDIRLSKYLSATWFETKKAAKAAIKPEGVGLYHVIIPIYVGDKDET